MMVPPVITRCPSDKLSPMYTPPPSPALPPVMVPDFAALLSVMVRVARPLTLSTLPVPVILNVQPFRSRVRFFVICSVAAISVLEFNVIVAPAFA